jgi:hypothetical protein
MFHKIKNFASESLMAFALNLDFSLNHVPLDFDPFFLLIVKVSHAFHLRLLLRELANDDRYEQVQNEKRRNKYKKDKNYRDPRIFRLDLTMVDWTCMHSPVKIISPVL